MKVYFTFGVQYMDLPHPSGMAVDPEGYLEVDAHDVEQARAAMFVVFGKEWSHYYTEQPEEKYFPHGCTMKLQATYLHLDRHADGSAVSCAHDALLGEVVGQSTLPSDAERAKAVELDEYMRGSMTQALHDAIARGDFTIIEITHEDPEATP